MRRFMALGALAAVVVPCDAGEFLNRLRRPAPVIIYESVPVVPPSIAPTIPSPAPLPAGPRVEAGVGWQTPLDLATVQPIYLPPEGLAGWPNGAPVASPAPAIPPAVEKTLHGLNDRLGTLDKRLEAMEKLLLLHDDMLRKDEKADKK